MKRHIILFLLISSLAQLKGQSSMTFREVYDFNVDDELQWYEYYGGTYGNTFNYRVKITSKRFSSNNDTVFYYRDNNNYSTSIDMSTSPPSTVYHVNIYSDTVYYTNLDSTVNSPYVHYVRDSCNTYHDSIYYPSEYCGAKTEDINYCGACCFEGQYTGEIYGQGLGLVSYDYFYSAYNVHNSKHLTYYKKDTVECGHRDTTSVGIKEYFISNSAITLFPNPTNDKLHVGGIKTPTLLMIYDILGNLVIEVKTSSATTIETQLLEKGVYMLLTENEYGKKSYRIIIARE